MQIWKSSEYSSIPNSLVSAYTVAAQGLEYTLIWLNNSLWQVLNMSFHRVLNMSPVLNMSGLKIWQRCEYVRVTQGAEYALVKLNMP